jgi:hypothetical protein
VTVQLQVDNADATIARAVNAGATLERPAQDEFYGERSGTIRDPFGHRWNICHHITDVSPTEMQRLWNERGGEIAAHRNRGGAACVERSDRAVRTHSGAHYNRQLHAKSQRGTRRAPD